MAQPAAAPAVAGQAAGGQAQQPAKSNALMSIVRMIAMWYMFKTFFGGGSKKPMTREELLVPQYPKGSSFDMALFLSEQPDFSRFSDASALVWQQRDIAFGTDGPRSHNYTYHPSQAVQNNGSVYLHAFFTPAGFSADPADPFFKKDAVFHKTFQLNTYLPRPKNKTGVNLLSSQAEQADARIRDAEAAEKPREIISYLKPYVSIALVDDATSYPAKAIPEHVAPHLDIDWDSMSYRPTVFFNEFWTLRENLVPVNGTLSELVIPLDLAQMGLWKFTIFQQVEKSFEMQRSFGAQGEGESDELKRVLLEGNPYFLALTTVVSLLHSVFDLLAFKNDIGFWKGKKNVEGLSVRTVGINCACQVIIFLYLVEEDTSYLILFSSFLGLLIEFWKLTQAMSISLDLSGRWPRIKFADKSSYTESMTKQYDAEAMRYLSYALYPLVIGYAIYALIYETHRSWYSWILHSLVGAVYTFGFILMCPQLYLNYKMKSVAHLPWRQLTYKFLNTIIDDLFAFVIKMPLLHRLSVFRDDIVFLIYLYQRWIYRVDTKRANEFGFSAEEPEAEAAAAAALASAPVADSSAGDAAAPAAAVPESKKEK